MIVVSLSTLLEVGGREDAVQDILSSFKCEKNSDVESFLHNNALQSEIRSFSRTTLVLDETNNNDVIGYFTTLIKNFDFKESCSKTAIGKLTGSRSSTAFNCVLIAQLGRSDEYKGLIPGEVILNLALDNCKKINDLAAVKVACVEYKEHPNLVKFYEYNGFTKLQENDNGYILSYVRL